jgi:SPOR domain
MAAQGWIQTGLMAAIGWALALGGGCANRPTASAEPKTDYAALYSSGQYQAALEASSKVAGSLRAYDKAKASLIAGLSAQALDRDADARKFLTPLLEESDDGISGKAAASLGLMAQQGGQHAAAADLLSTAAGKLMNDDKARAAMYAGDSYRAIGKLDEAERHYLLARQTIREEAGLQLLVSDRLAKLGRQKEAAKMAGVAPSTPLLTKGGHSTGPDSKRLPGPPVGGASQLAAQPKSGVAAQERRVDTADGRNLGVVKFEEYTVQAGTFATWKSAVAMMSELKRFGGARIVEARDPFGRRLYNVRVGRFSTTRDAEGMRSRVGRSAEIVTAE